MTIRAALTGREPFDDAAALMAVLLDERNAGLRIGADGLPRAGGRNSVGLGEAVAQALAEDRTARRRAEIRPRYFLSQRGVVSGADQLLRGPKELAQPIDRETCNRTFRYFHDESGTSDVVVDTLRRMTDFLSPETRSRVMARIRSKDTKPELAVRKGLYALGVRGWRCHPKSVPGKPDLAFGQCKLAVFIDGRFWHGHPDYFTFGKSGPYWDEKIRRTQERDRSATEMLVTVGWEVLRFWDFEVEDDLASVLDAICAALAEARGRAETRVPVSAYAGS